MTAAGGLIFLFGGAGGGALPATTPPTFNLYLLLSPVWIMDISNRLMAFESSWGREDEFSGVQPATLRLSLDDDDAGLDPQWTAGPLYGDLDLNTPVVLTATRGGVTYPLGYGYIDDFTPQPTTLGANLELSATDEFQHLEGKQVSATFAAGLEGARIDDLLDNVGFLGTRDLSAGWLDLPAATLTDTPMTTHLDDVLRAALGLFWFGPDGAATYRDRHDRLTQASVGHFGAGGDYPVREVRPSYNRAGLYNQARMTRGGGAVNAQQRLTLAVAPSTIGYALSFRGSTSPAVVDFTAAGLQAALQATSTIGSGNASVSGGPLTSSPLTITFTGALAGQALPLLEVAWAMGPAGSSVTLTVSELTAGAATALEVNDSASQAKYGVHTYVLPDASAALLPNDADRTDWLTWLVAEHATPQTRASELLVDPYGHADLWALALSSDLGTRITVSHDLPGSRGIVDVDYFVEGITHRAVLAGTPDYTVTWRLSRGTSSSYWWLDTQVQLGVDTRLAY